jgi:hypothetical protein
MTVRRRQWEAWWFADMREHGPYVRRWPRAVRRRTVYLVVALDSGLVKIGVAGNVARRLRELRREVGAARLVALFPGTRADERALHRRFSELRVHGEWFRDDPAIRQAFAEALTSRLGPSVQRRMPGTSVLRIPGQPPQFV